MATALTLIDALAEWVGSQRWFVGGGMHPRLALIASVTLHDDADTQVHILVVSDDGGARPVLYQVPVVLRRGRREDSDVGFIGAVTDGDADDGADPWFAYDGPTDPEFTDRLLDLLIVGGEFSGGNDGAAGQARVWASAGEAFPNRNVRSSVLRGEQSNTSIVYSSNDDAGTPRLICKIFRMLHHGDNPDVVLQTALFHAGSTSVPEILGSIAGEWPESTPPTGVARGHLAFAQHFVPGAEDGWTRALDAVSRGVDFADDARRIGTATADVHATLASVLETRAASDADVADTVFAWQRRLDAAIAEVPELEPERRTIEALYSRAEAAPWPQLQRIHGDLHLGQVLATPDGGWMIIDFEGEPMRPLDERARLDLPVRDIAGMLRSIDYAAGSHTASAGALDWARSCREAFLDGYIERAHDNVRQNPELLDACELDKALYEVVYEAHNRPAWLPIPIAAVRRLANRAENLPNFDR
jgi:predicted trehalose synthase